MTPLHISLSKWKCAIGSNLRVGFIATVLLLAAPSAAAAASNNNSPEPNQAGITLSPTLEQVVMGPGLIEAKTYITVANNTDHTFSAAIKLVDFKALDDYGDVSLGQVGIPISKYGLAKWMSLPGGNTINLHKGQSTRIEVDIQNRNDLTPGGHYGAVVLSAASGSDLSSNQVGLNQQLVSLIFLKKLGGDIYGLNLKSISLGNHSGFPVSVTMLFQSTGNVYVIPRGYIEVTNPIGKLVAKGVINQDSRLIMQGSSQQLISLLQPLASSSQPGRYKVTAYYRYDGENHFSQKIIYFTRSNWSLRLTLAVIVGTVLLLLLFTVRRMRKKRIRKSLNK